MTNAGITEERVNHLQQIIIFCFNDDLEGKD